MKKTILFFVLFFATITYSQIDYNDVLDLLIKNKRSEARQLFDKKFNKVKDSNIDLLFIDAMIDEENGQIDFDETLLKKIENLPNASYYIMAFINSNYVCADLDSRYFSDDTYQKIDFLGNSDKFKNLSIVQYRKAFFEQRRYNKTAADKIYNEIECINKWQYCGVFENLNGSGLDIEYGPEFNAKSDKEFDGNSNGFLGWYNKPTVSKDPYFFLANEGEYGAGIMYVQSFVTSADSKSVFLKFGANLGLKIFLNDKEVYLNTDIQHTNLDAYTIKINLQKGVNRLLFKLETKSEKDYFSAQIRNLDNSIAKELIYNDKFLPYEINKNETIETQEIQPDFEKYFDDLVAKNPENVLYKLYRFLAYSINEKKVKALESLEGLDEKYPASSFLSKFFISYYSFNDDQNQKVKEILKSIETNDKDHYLITISKFLDQSWIKNTTIQELEKYKQVTSSYKQNYCELMFDFIISSKKSDIDLMLKQYHELIAASHNNERFYSIEAELILALKNDKSRSLSILENLYKKKDIYEIGDALINKYNDLNEKSKANKIMTDRLVTYPEYNSIRTDLINVYISENNYKKALELVDINLSYAPYSFINMEKKASIYSLMKNYTEAEKYMRKSLVHNAGNGDLRKQLYDITKNPNEIEEIETKDIYKVIKERRGSKLATDKGIVTLLDQYIVNVFPEGGRKSKVVFVYEVTAENGIEEIKEYSISLSYNNVIKSEIVRTNGDVIPAEKGDNLLVFTNLQVGDVVYIEYEKFENSSGRFYKDFNITNYFDSTYPVVEGIFAIIHPEDLQLNAVFTNGEVPIETKKINNKIAKIWTKKNIPAMRLLENYAPIYADLTNAIQTSTIKNWKEISNWYADLVRKNIKLDKITTKTFAEIFPEGFSKLSQEQVAKKIYTYIEKNITYSSLDFRQSGYVPQKPSKTITTKLGDCKDVSTLFVALSQMAGLKANLVLVSTNDNGFSNMLVPSRDFNHCIVKVVIDQKEYFLELTNKFMPFKALPRSLYQANALVISFDKNENENCKLIQIPFSNALKNSNSSKSVVTVGDNSKEFKILHTNSGTDKAYYNELFSAATTDIVRKDAMEKEYNSMLKKVVVLKSNSFVKNEMFDPEIKFNTEFSIAERLQSVGAMKIITLPFTEKVYTRDLIEDETRKNDIVYFNYESFNNYNSEIILNIDATKKFIEIPLNKILTFKNHNYKINFELVKPNSLKITRIVNTNRENIAAADYLQFKKFVEDVIEIEDQIIGFK